MFAQDTWTRKRLTLNYGGRFDHFNAEVPAQSSPAGPWIAARDFAAIQERAELERLVGATGRRLRSVRERQDRAEGERRQLRGVAGRRFRGDLQRDDLRDADRAPGSTPTATAPSSTPPATSSSTRSWAEHPTSVRSPPPGPEHRAGYNWEYSALSAARTGAARRRHRGLLSPRLLQPAGHRQPEHQHRATGTRSASSRPPTPGCPRPGNLSTDSA